MKAYENPSIETLGTVTELTLLNAKCGGSGDLYVPVSIAQLENQIQPVDHCPAP